MLKIDKHYLSGDIYFQIWPPGSSSETRLYVGENAEKKSYDCIKYENQMFRFANLFNHILNHLKYFILLNWIFRFNTVERVECYKHNVQVPGLG